MTHTIPPDSPRARHAIAFGLELQKACAARDVSLKELERTLTVGHTTLWNYRFGRSLPKLAVATSLAIALDWPKLRDLVVKARTRTCRRDGCGVTFVNDVGSEAKKYCSVMCGRVAVNIKQAETRARSAGQTGSFQTRRAHIQRLRAAVRFADDRSRLLTDAIAEMCLGCEPEGLCRTAGCPLRDFSPLPLAGRRDVVPSTTFETRRRSWTPERKDNQRDANARRWARPGEREAQSERTAAMHARRTPDEVAAIASKAKASYPAARRSVVSTQMHAARRQAAEGAS